jgi:hypothetical protein
MIAASNRVNDGPFFSLLFLGAAVPVAAVAPGEGEPQPAVAVVHADEQRQDRHPEDSLDADQLTEDHHDRGRHNRLGQQQHAGRRERRSRGAQGDLHAGREDQDADQRQRTVAEQGGREVAEPEEAGRERADDRADDEGDEHEAAGDAVHAVEQWNATLDL